MPRPAIGTTRGVGTKAGVVAEGEEEAVAVIVANMGVDTGVGIHTGVDIVVVAVAVAAIGTTPLWWPTGTPSCPPGGLYRKKAPSRCGKVPTRGLRWWGICPVEPNAEWWAASRWSIKAKGTPVCT